MTAEKLNTALLSRYVKEDGRQPTLEAEAVETLLAELPGEALAGKTTLAAAITASAPDAVLPPRERAIIASVDDCLKMIESIMDVEVEVEQQLRRAIPDIARHLVRDPGIALSTDPTILTVLDQLVFALAGWSTGLGRAGEKLIEQLDTTISSLKSSDDIAGVDEALRAFIGKEQSRIAKLEERLAASETGQLRSQQSRALATEMINRAMARKQLTPAITEFLKGPWFDSAQLVVLTQGVESEGWSRMRALTETIIWTYQPIESDDDEVVQKEKQRLYRIIEHLPGEIRDLLLALEHDTGTAESALQEIEQDHVMLVSGQELEYEEFELIASDEEEGARPAVSRMLLKKLANFDAGQWFHYRSDEVDVRIKLLLKLDDVRQLLFTNRNGMKVMQRSFEEFAYYLSTGVVKAVNVEAIFSNTFRTFYEGLVEEHSKQQKRIAERKAERDRAEEEREEARQKALQEATELERQQEEAAREARAEARATRLEDAKKAMEEADAATIEAITKRVSELAVGAWLKLPGALGELEECKLAVKISAADKMIFVSQSGTKVGEYSSDELIRLLVAGQGEIRDEGIEFEDTLQQVVSRLRQDRHKSYDDLTGE